MFDYIVWCEEFGQLETDGIGIIGGSQKEAVISWAMNNDHLICDGAYVVVGLRNIGSGESFNYNVSCDLMPEYSVRKVKK